MLKTKTDLLGGNILKSLLIFAIPLFISNLFQSLYTTADMAIVGHFLGETSLAAIGASEVIFQLLVGFAIGVGGGFGLVVARSYGAGDMEQLKRTVAGAIISGGLLTVFISITASVFMMPFLRFLNVPADIINNSYSYISILISFAIVLFTYNLCAGLLRAIGNSLTPLLFLIISSLLNICLDLLFIVGFGMGLRGVAAATVVAQGISATLCLIYIFRKCPILVPHKEHFRYNAVIYKELLTQGLSMGIMLSIVTIGSVILQRATNSLGYLVIAGHVAVRKLNLFCMLPIPTLGIALSTFVSQNKGANQLDRIRKAVRYGNTIAVVWSVFMSLVLFIFARFLIKHFTGSNEQIIIDNGTRYLMINAPFYMVLGILLNLRNALQGIGQKIIPIVSSILELIGKVTFAFLLVPSLGYFAVIICEPVIWCAMCLLLVFSFYGNAYIRGKVR